MSCASSHASSALRTRLPSGTGTPHALSSVLVRSLSLAMLSAIALVRSVSAVQMRRCAAPWPSCTRLPSVRRIDGIRRSVAASTMCAVDGPRQCSSTRSFSDRHVGGQVVRRCRRSRPSAARGRQPARRARHARRGCGTPSCRCRSSPVERVLPKPVRMPARFCSSSTTCSRMWPAQVPSRRRSRKPPCSPTPQRCTTRPAATRPAARTGRESGSTGESSSAPISTTTSMTGR